MLGRQTSHAVRGQSLQRLTARLLKALFLEAPCLTSTPEKAAAFDALLSTAVQGGVSPPIDYTAPYPKHEFLTHLARRHAVLLYGSTRPDIQQLQPRPQMDHAGHTRAIAFASGDGIWPIFLAILDPRKLRGSPRHGCFVVSESPHTEQRFYFFSISAESLAAAPWTEGSVYLLLRSSFAPIDQGAIRLDAWESQRPVYPLARLPIVPEDFPFLHRVAGHRESESMLISWLSYKWRIRSHNRSTR